MSSNRLYEFTTNSRALQRPMMEHQRSPSYIDDDTESIAQDHRVFSVHPGSEPQNKYVQGANDAVKLMDDIISDTQKHPVSKLNEIVEIINWDKVEYSIVNVVFEDTHYFICSATSNCIVVGTVNGTGKSKKEAKKNAAIFFMEKLRSNYNNIFTNEEMIPLSNEVINHVGELQSFCLVNLLPFPVYECINDTSRINRFTIKCSLYGFTTQGNGKKKQAAKSEAASLMYNQIKDLPSRENENHSHNKSQTPSTVLRTYSESVNDETMQPSSVLQEHNNSANPMTQDKDNAFSSLDFFFDRLKSSTNPSLSRLRTIKCIHLYRMDTIKTLIDILNEEGFTAHYEIVPDQSSNLVKVTIRLSVAPTLMHMGYGITAPSALREAGYNVLVYLKLILSK